MSLGKEGAVVCSISLAYAYQPIPMQPSSRQKTSKAAYGRRDSKSTGWRHKCKAQVSAGRVDGEMEKGDKV